MKNKAELNKTERIQKLLKEGHDPEVIAYDVGCSKQYVYNVRAKINKGKATGVDALVKPKAKREQAALPSRRRKVKAAPKVGTKPRAKVQAAVAKQATAELITAPEVTIKPGRVVIHCITGNGQVLTTVSVTKVANKLATKRILSQLGSLAN